MATTPGRPLPAGGAVVRDPASRPISEGVRLPARFPFPWQEFRTGIASFAVEV